MAYRVRYGIVEVQQMTNVMCEKATANSGKDKTRSAGPEDLVLMSSEASALDRIRFLSVENTGGGSLAGARDGGGWWIAEAKV